MPDSNNYSQVQYPVIESTIVDKDMSINRLRAAHTAFERKEYSAAVASYERFLSYGISPFQMRLDGIGPFHPRGDVYLRVHTYLDLSLVHSILGSFDQAKSAREAARDYELNYLINQEFCKGGGAVVNQNAVKTELEEAQKAADLLKEEKQNAFPSLGKDDLEIIKAGERAIDEIVERSWDRRPNSEILLMRELLNGFFLIKDEKYDDAIKVFDSLISNPVWSKKQPMIYAFKAKIYQELGLKNEYMHAMQLSATNREASPEHIQDYREALLENNVTSIDFYFQNMSKFEELYDRLNNIPDSLLSSFDDCVSKLSQALKGTMVTMVKVNFRDIFLERMSDVYAVIDANKTRILSDDVDAARAHNMDSLPMEEDGFHHSYDVDAAAAEALATMPLGSIFGDGAGCSLM